MFSFRRSTQRRYYIPNDDLVDIIPTSTAKIDNWTIMFNRLKDIKDKKIAVSRNKNTVTDADFDDRLRYWINAQLHQIHLFVSGERKRLPHSMSLDRSKQLLKVLRELGYKFDFPTPTNTNTTSTKVVNTEKTQIKNKRKRKSSFDLRLEELEEFKRTHGHCDVPQTYPPNKKLGHWVNRLRSTYKNIPKNKKKSFLTPERINSLESVGFLWVSNHNEKRWLHQYEKIVEYYTKHGNCDVPKAYPELGIWVHSQRINYKKKRLSTEQILLLERIGFCWSFYALTPWEDRLEELRLYKKKHGDCLVPRQSGQLGTWVNRQRKEYKYLMDGKKTAMTSERINKLNEVGFAWKHPSRGRRPMKTIERQAVLNATQV